MPIIYRAPASYKEFENYFNFRWKQLRKPLGLEQGSERDKLEDTAFHMAAFAQENIIGIGRLQIEGDNIARIRYMAVAENYQNQTIGSTILNKLEQIAINHKIHKCWLYARQSATQFYIKNGYTIFGKSCSELSGIPHERMEKALHLLSTNEFR